MGRGKNPMERIEETSRRQVAFSKRRSSLFKKAHELAVLCDAEVAIVIFSSTGRMYSFASPTSNMRMILERYYKKSITGKKNDVQDAQMDSNNVAEHNLFTCPQNIRSLDSEMLCKLEEQLRMQLCFVRKIKDQKMFEQIKELHMKECYLRDENESLNDMVAKLERRSNAMSEEDPLSHNRIVNPSNPT